MTTPMPELPIAAWAKRINIGTEFEQYCFSPDQYGEYKEPFCKLSDALAAIEAATEQGKPAEGDAKDAERTILENTQVIRDIGETLNQNGWSLSGQKLQECALAIERAAIASQKGLK